MSKRHAAAGKSARPYHAQPDTVTVEESFRDIGDVSLDDVAAYRKFPFATAHIFPDNSSGSIAASGFG